MSATKGGMANASSGGISLQGQAPPVQRIQAVPKKDALSGVQFRMQHILQAAQVDPACSSLIVAYMYPSGAQVRPAQLAGIIVLRRESLVKLAELDEEFLDFMA